VKEYKNRFYREWVKKDDLEKFSVSVKDSDLFILCDKDLKAQALNKLEHIRGELEGYIARYEIFGSVLKPYLCQEGSPQIVKDMCAAAALYDVGPMASVAGVFSKVVGKELLKYSDTVIVENGGDIFARSEKPIKFALYAGEGSPFSNIVFELNAKDGVGICTSSATVGPSFSFGNADAVVAIADDAGVADAAATHIANRIRLSDDIDKVLRLEKEKGILNALIACSGDKIGFWGEIEIVR
jgi:ApbE superfamily uncharacterized protein (UPF0280 family)